MTQLSLIVLKTKHLDHLKTFYSGFGITFQLEQHSTGPEHYAGTLDGTVFELYPSNKPDNITLGFTVENFDTIEKTLHRYITLRKQDHYELQDPDRRRIFVYKK